MGKGCALRLVVVEDQARADGDGVLAGDLQERRDLGVALERVSSLDLVRLEPPAPVGAFGFQPAARALPILRCR